ncbi:capping protein inhibiting regulator of actin dynamics-like isoform X2 [Mya arenaria]|uniref:capping protein inhibiting regulator of actin dynamics-like isoform X2 n=1 Tax=Mya arenaria TaxID=6604 RepID=UPI0022E65063|nr:capping protein inhibiting regulator of actin dynamics-like isoform X2 [Mya arenaria]
MPEMATTYHGGGSQSPTAISKPIERVFEDAQHTGEILLNGRKLREYPKLAAKYDLVDTISADVSKNRMAEVPKELCLYISMEKLNCYHNVIKSIPESLVQLQALTYLNLSRNQLSIIPPFISQLQTLEVLIASHNRLVSLPEEIGVLDKLMELDVSCNEISHLPLQIGDLKSLKSLNVRRNLLQELPVEISKLNLRKLDISSNRISKIPTVFRKIETLEEILLENNPLTLPPAHVCTRGKQHIMKYLQITAIREDKARLGMLSEIDMKRFRKSLPPAVSGSTEEFRTLLDNPDKWKRHTVLSSDSGYSTTDSVDKCGWSPQENGVDLPHIVESNNLAMRAAAAVCREPCYPAPAVTYREPRRPPPEPPMRVNSRLSREGIPETTPPPPPRGLTRVPSTEQTHSYSPEGQSGVSPVMLASNQIPTVIPPQTLPKPLYSNAPTPPTLYPSPQGTTPLTPPTPQGPGPGVGLVSPGVPQGSILGTSLEDEFTRELQRQKQEYESKKKAAELLRIQHEEEEERRTAVQRVQAAEEEEREARRRAAQRIQEEQQALLNKQREVEESKRHEEQRLAAEAEARRAEEQARREEEARHRNENNFYFKSNSPLYNTQAWQPSSSTLTNQKSPHSASANRTSPLATHSLSANQISPRGAQYSPSANQNCVSPNGSNYPLTSRSGHVPPTYDSHVVHRTPYSEQQPIQQQQQYQREQHMNTSASPVYNNPIGHQQYGHTPGGRSIGSSPNDFSSPASSVYSNSSPGNYGNSDGRSRGQDGRQESSNTQGLVSSPGYSPQYGQSPHNTSNHSATYSQKQGSGAYSYLASACLSNDKNTVNDHERNERSSQSTEYSSRPGRQHAISHGVNEYSNFQHGRHDDHQHDYHGNPPPYGYHEGYHGNQDQQYIPNNPPCDPYGVQRKPGLSLSNSFKDERRSGEYQYRRTVSDSNTRLPDSSHHMPLTNGPLEEQPSMNGDTPTPTNHSTDSSPNSTIFVPSPGPIPGKTIPNPAQPVVNGPGGDAHKTQPNVQQNTGPGPVSRKPKTSPGTTGVGTTSRVGRLGDKPAGRAPASNPTTSRTGPGARKTNLNQDEELRKSNSSLKSLEGSKPKTESRLRSIQKDGIHSYGNRRSTGSTSSDDDRKRSTPTRTLASSSATSKRSGTGMSNTTRSTTRPANTTPTSSRLANTNTSKSSTAGNMGAKSGASSRIAGSSLPGASRAGIVRRDSTSSTTSVSSTKSKSSVDKTKRSGTVMTSAHVKMLDDYSKEAGGNHTLRRQHEQHQDLQHQLELLRKTISTRLKRSLPENLSEALSDGVLLCHLANQIRPRSVASVHVPSPAVPKLTPPKCRKNVENFLEACRKIGVPKEQICESSDILAEKGLHRVAHTVASLVAIGTHSKHPASAV